MFVTLILALISFQQTLAISICGDDGHVIGRPDATIKLYQQDVSGRLTCRRLDNHVTQGIIAPPTQEQQALIDVICDCQPHNKKSNLMNTGRELGNSPTHGLRQYPSAADLAKPTSSNAPSIPVPFYVFLPSINPPTSAPYSLLNFSPTLSPQEQMRIRSNKERILIVLGVCICVTVTFLISFICVVTFQQRSRSLASRRTNIDAITTCSGIQESDDILKERRRIVISLLFPVQGTEATQEPQTLGDHEGAQSSMEPESENQCPICLEDANDDLIIGRCSHLYHRECIMTWMHDGHNECPNCRQLMWDQDAYNLLHQYVKANGIKVLSK